MIARILLVLVFAVQASALCEEWQHVGNAPDDHDGNDGLTAMDATCASHFGAGARVCTLAEWKATPGVIEGPERAWVSGGVTDCSGFTSTGTTSVTVDDGDVTSSACYLGLDTACCQQVPVGLDTDEDGIPDVLDKCVEDDRNVGAADCDTDQDGYGNVCDGDFDQNGSVLAADYSTYFVPAFKSGVDSGRGEDMDCSGTVASPDFTNYFGPQFSVGAPGPSGLDCAGTAPCP